ncbi:MAG TPA: hypothetical protein VMR76_03510 [Candidatus Saccharimonadia bacterium]|nr:hypothetical protein [Candidatus Saccharimonadia bacterium]
MNTRQEGISVGQRPKNSREYGHNIKLQHKVRQAVAVIALLGSFGTGYFANSNAGRYFFGAITGPREITLPASGSPEGVTVAFTSSEIILPSSLVPPFDATSLAADILNGSNLGNVDEVSAINAELSHEFPQDDQFPQIGQAITVQKTPGSERLHAIEKQYGIL